MTLHADSTLAAAIEASVARDLARYATALATVRPGAGVATARIAGGVALFAGAGSPVNMLFGAGLGGSVTTGDLDAIEAFFAGHGTRAAISLSPLADESLVAGLSARGWTLTDFENVLVRPLAPSDASAQAWPQVGEGVAVRLATAPEERARWARVEAEAFSAPEEPTSEVLALGEAALVRDDLTLLFASVDGRDAATGALWVDGELGWLLHDATLPAARRRGAQSALLAERTRLAAEAGCMRAVTEARPGSTSQRNMERLGFRVVYTRVELIAPPPRR